MGFIILLKIFLTMMGMFSVSTYTYLHILKDRKFEVLGSSNMFKMRVSLVFLVFPTHLPNIVRTGQHFCLIRFL